MSTQSAFDRKVNVCSVLATTLCLFIVCLACTLVSRGWVWTSVLLIVLVEGAILAKLCLALNNNDFPNPSRSNTLLCTLACARVLFLLLVAFVYVTACFGWAYSRLVDPSTTIQSIGVSVLGKAVEEKPQAYVVQLIDGYVPTAWTGHYRGTRQREDSTLENEEVAVAPVFRNSDMSSLSRPYAWVIGIRDVHPSYCASGGLCGFYAGAMASEGVQPNVDEGYNLLHAAKDAAEKGGFEFEPHLPMLREGDPEAYERRYSYWYGWFWPALCGMVTFALAQESVALRRLIIPVPRDGYDQLLEETLIR